MNKSFSAVLVAIFVFVAFSGLASAHMMDDFSQASGDGIGTMRYLEDQVLGSDAHEEMEGLMQKMLVGNLTESDSTRMVELMNEYPAPYGMMMNRMTAGSSQYEDHRGVFGSWGGMMGYGFSWSWSLMALIYIVWLVVGILVIVWITKKIKNDK